MNPYTPKNIFRNPVPFDWDISKSVTEVLREKIRNRLVHGDGIIFAAYDLMARTGLIRAVGLVEFLEDGSLDFNLKPTDAEIGVTSSFGHKFWQQQDGFRFADKKLGDYGLSQMFAEKYDGMSLRACPIKAARGTNIRIRRSEVIPKERLTPIEVIGAPTNSAKGGYVYVLKSTHGYKVGRTVNVPSRMRAFGVLLPFVYTIELCAWFDDHIMAEREYHRIFTDKHLNGEWFSLTPSDVDMIRKRVFS